LIDIEYHLAEYKYLIDKQIR